MTENKTLETKVSAGQDMLERFLGFELLKDRHVPDIDIDIDIESRLNQIEVKEK